MTIPKGLLILAAGLLSVFLLVAFMVVTTQLFKKEGVVAKSEDQAITNKDGDKVVIARLGTSSIKKLTIDDGSIYFTDGWAVFIPKQE